MAVKTARCSHCGGRLSGVREAVEAYLAEHVGGVAELREATGYSRSSVEGALTAMRREDPPSPLLANYRRGPKGPPKGSPLAGRPRVVLELVRKLLGAGPLTRLDLIRRSGRGQSAIDTALRDLRRERSPVLANLRLKRRVCERPAEEPPRPSPAEVTARALASRTPLEEAWR